MIVALSSGEGGVFTDENFFAEILKRVNKSFKFLSFLVDELSTFLSCNKHENDAETLEQVKKITNSNPALVNLYLKTSTVVQFQVKVDKYIHEYISSTLAVLQKYVDKNFEQGFNLTPYFLKCAVHEHEIPKEF